MDGQFITFEGNDGAGKTTVLNRIIEILQPKLGNQLVTTREPGGNLVSEKIRNIIMNNEMDARTEALLFAAARREHLVRKIIPALEHHKLVLCDRYVDSSIAYQGAGRKIGEKQIADMNQFATNHIMPNLTIYFDVPVEVGLKRIMQHRTNEINRLDRQQHDFYIRVHDAYDKIAQSNPKRVVKVDATKPVDEVVANVLEIIKQRFPQYFE